ncbi:Retrotransposon-like protein [Gossypium australe]|uniref:Retrotransposon-like protein n=1 Tax=Gossypium australe TaxID=47621 RepID=A0A5B6W875_9ROSI|nr:Retrotransposon-like protein [Gossypium australe]
MVAEKLVQKGREVEILDVFLEKLSRLPPECEVEFKIELLSGTALVSIAPYRMEPNKLKELKCFFVGSSGNVFKEEIRVLKLNKLTVKNKYHLPRTDDLFDQF